MTENLGLGMISLLNDLSKESLSFQCYFACYLADCKREYYQRYPYDRLIRELELNIDLLYSNPFPFLINININWDAAASYVMAFLNIPRLYPTRGNPLDSFINILRLADRRMIEKEIMRINTMEVGLAWPAFIHDILYKTRYPSASISEIHKKLIKLRGGEIFLHLEVGYEFLIRDFKNVCRRAIYISQYLPIMTNSKAAYDLFHKVLLGFTSPQMDTIIQFIRKHDEAIYYDLDGLKISSKQEISSKPHIDQCLHIASNDKTMCDMVRICYSRTTASNLVPQDVWVANCGRSYEGNCWGCNTTIDQKTWRCQYAAPYLSPSDIKSACDEFRPVCTDCMNLMVRKCDLPLHQVPPAGVF